MTTTVRPLTPEDAETAMRLWHRSWLDTYVCPERGVTAQWIEEWWRPRLGEDGIAGFARRLAEAGGGPGGYLAAEVEGTLTGIASSYVDPEAGQTIGSLYVDRAFHRRGVGAALLRAMLERFDPAQPVHLRVASYNETAIAFYVRAGFRRVPGSESMFADRIPEFAMIRPAGA